MKTNDFNNSRIAALRLTLLLVMMFIINSLAWGQSLTQTNPGNYNFTVPDGVTSITIEAWGGGGGGGADNEYYGTGAGGGGGGAYAKINSYTVTPGNSYTYTVGAVGAGGTGSNNGGNGGNSSFNTTICVAQGGRGGEARNDGAGGAGGTTASSTGDIKYAGGSGSPGISGSTPRGGGGGGSAGTGEQGNSATSGTGATAVTGGGPGGNGGNNSNGSTPASGPGGGGGGAENNGTTGTNGGAGYSGKIVITWTPCASPSISTHPTSQTANVGGSVTFSVTATGTGLSYQWHKGTNIISDATNASYTISPVAAGDAVTNYNVVITGTCGTVTSNNAALTINPQPSASVTGQTNLTCFGVPGGSITILASGGSGTGYTFSVDNGLTYVGNGNPYTFTGLSASTPYKIRVKDSIGSESPAIP